MLSDGTLYGQFDDDVNKIHVRTNIGEVNTNQWHHAAITRESGVGYRMYFNASPRTLAPEDNGDLSNTADLVFGAMDGVQDYYKGSLDDVRIYNRALSAEEIAEIHAAGTLGLAAQDCENPNGAEGAIIYNLDENAPQYCDGAQWVRMGGP